MPRKNYIVIDYHKKYSYINIKDETGKTIRQGKMANNKEMIKKFLGEYAKDSKGVMEATRNWTVMYDWMEEMLDEMVLAHPMKVKAIAEAKIKTDKIDANVLGDLLRADLIPESYVPNKRTREIKNILRQRMFMVRIKTMIKNRIHTLIDRHSELRAEVINLGVDIFGKKGKEWLKKVDIKGFDKKLLKKEYELLEELEKQLKDTEKLMEKLLKKDKEAQLLKTIPGLGTFFSLLVANEIDNIDRFWSSKKLNAYAGLAPSTYSSGGKTFHRRIIKQGNKWLRWAMVEAVWPAISKDESLKSLYYRYKKRSGSANKAKVALAKRLLSIVFKVLKDKRPF